MLYVVFTFGEMIIVIAEYFEGGLNGSSVYFSLMCFLIVVGLFLCYGVLYDRIIDRERMDNGMGYMMLHVFLLFGMNSLTTSLEFMRDEAVALWPKTIFLILSFLLFFVCLFWLQNKYSKPDLHGRVRIADAPPARISEGQYLRLRRLCLRALSRALALQPPGVLPDPAAGE